MARRESLAEEFMNEDHTHGFSKGLRDVNRPRTSNG